MAERFTYSMSRKPHYHRKGNYRFYVLCMILVREEDCQFIIATHSPIILGYPDATILSFDDGEIKETEYEMTEHYQITKYFLDHREKFLKDILED